MICVKVEQLFFSNMGFVVLLKGPSDKRTLPIFVGAAEAQAIALQINNVKMSRPLTHDLFKNTLDFLECRVKRIEVCDLREGTFYAKLILERDGMEMGIDSRPSDAIAIALRASAPIYVTQTVMEQAGRIFTEKELQMTGSEKEGDHPKGKKQLNPIDTLKQELEKAVNEERFEDAAMIRDRIKDIEHTHSAN
ncbi:MAG: bifunctional nuclease family protein [Kiritimatiellae bacterium]|nr:bifunctional nuclease family protein [Kiritimatiellia bacterium]MDD5520614.1 bifunctional nuclease family protein [Kiritimatiellia bacterium]